RTIAPIVSSAVFDFARSNPKAVPMTIDKNKPINKCRKLARISYTNVKSFTPAYKDFPTDNGLGIMDSGQISMATNPCQIASNKQKKITRLIVTCIMQLLIHYLVNFGF